ncbi:MAG TPA: quinone-dependent dihydroorotate dehydrogenase [Chthoniobacterales bacterium]
MSTNGFYQTIVRPMLFLRDAESAHEFALGSLRRASALPPLLALLRRSRPPEQPRTLFGVTFPNPIGLAAGFDKNGVALPALAALGFGFVELGTVTARAQPGNPRPRMFRYPREQALINRLGFNNDGADRVANHLRQLRESGRWPAIPIGINIGKSKLTPIDQAPADYLHSFRRLRNFADYIVLNVSSPNTPGLRSLQAEEPLSFLLQVVQEENRTNKPIVVKISPDLPVADLEQIVAACEAHRVAAIIATNTTVEHSALALDRDEQGGLSGPPLRERSTALIRAIAAQTAIPIIGCGGICDAESAREKMEAGAQLLQIYTGLVYRGPGLIKELAEAVR